MPTQHVASQGEGIDSIAFRYGHFPQTIWLASGNEELRTRRHDPNALLPGDIVVIPDKRLKEEKRETDAKYRFRVRNTPSTFQLRIFDGDRPRAGVAFELKVDGREFRGNADDSGTLTVRLPPDAKTGELVIGPERTRYTLRFGHLDPEDEVSGMQKRLKNLGIPCDDPDGKLGDSTRRALRSFQARFKLPVTGEPDRATLDRLVAVHDGNEEFPPP